MNRGVSGEEFVAIDLAREADFELGRLRVSPSLCELRCGEATETIEPRVMQALVALAGRKGAVVSRDELVQRCWSGLAVGDDAINRCIGKVRRLADLDGGRSFRVDTVPRVGYRLIELRDDASPVAPDPQPSDLSAQAGSAYVPAARAPVWWMLAGAGLLLIALAVYLLFRASSHPAPQSEAVRAAIVRPPSAAALPSGAVFADCVDGCPDMVIVPAGYFDMGTANSEAANAPNGRLGLLDNETPQHEVLIAKRFAVARYDVTREEFARFATETHRPDDGSCKTLAPSGLFVETIGANWRHPGFAQSERDPVVCVNWHDAAAYAAWLARKTGKPYRLLSEAEWEYAARAHDIAPRLATAATDCAMLNGAEAAYHRQYPGDKMFDPNCDDGFAATSPVGRFPANGFGLFDMQGNAAQWTADCYHASFDGAPTDGSPWLSGDCTQRAARGSSWAADSRDIHFALRMPGAANSRYSANGFRVARSLEE